MSGRRSWVVASALLVVLARVDPASGAVLDRGTAEAHAAAARADGRYGFCATPSKPLSRSARRLCALATSIDDCNGYAAACAEVEAPSKAPSSFGAGIEKLLGYLSLAAVVVALLAAIGALAVAVLRLLRGRRDAPGHPDAPPPPVVVGAEPILEEVSVADAERLLRSAGEHAAAGRLDLALYTYLGAALRALDDRGAIRVARHRTHGEYVRECVEEAARPRLRELVRDVDVVRFGGGVATAEAIGRAGSSATAIVRAPSPPPRIAGIASLGLLAIGLLSCGGGLSPRGSDPAGDDLLVDLLTREGATVRHLQGPLASLAVGSADGAAIVVDTESTPLDDETKAHLVAWVHGGGRIVLAGDPDRWPEEFWARRAITESRDVRVQTPCPDEDDACAPPRLDRALLAAPAAMTWPHEEPFPTSASLDSGELYAAARAFGDGVVLGLASDDLLTNAGLSVKGNPAALVALLESLDRTEFLVARRENGISPPSNPFSGLVRIGLGLGLFHALFFAALLFLSVGLRHARPVPDAAAPRRAFTEHVRATGHLYARAKAAAHALSVFARYVDLEVRARAPRGTSPAHFLAQRAGTDPTETVALYERAMSARDDAGAVDDLDVLSRMSALYARAVRDSGAGPRKVR